MNTQFLAHHWSCHNTQKSRNDSNDAENKWDTTKIQKKNDLKFLILITSAMNLLIKRQWVVFYDLSAEENVLRSPGCNGANSKSNRNRRDSRKHQARTEFIET